VQQQIIPSWGIPLITRILPLVECGLALLLLTGIEPIIGSAILAGLFIFFLIVKFILLFTNHTEDCGCFGSAKPQKIDGANLIVSLLISIFTVLHLWLIIQFPSVNWQWRIVAIVILGIGWGFLLGKTIERRRKSSGSSSIHFIGLGGISKGEKAPTFAGVDQDNQTIRLDMFGGKWLFLAFVLPGCRACPGILKALQQMKQDEPTVSVLTVGGADLEVNIKYAREQKVNFPIITSTPELVNIIYRIQVFPFIFILDKEGIVRARGAANSYELLQDLLRTVDRNYVASSVVLTIE
jgi:peroxiredoxin